MNTRMSRTDLHNAIKIAITKAAPELSAALAWLESTDPTLDVDDAKLAEASCRMLLADGYQGEGEMPLSVYAEAAESGALMIEEDWERLETKECNEIDMMISCLRGME